MPSHFGFMGGNAGSFTPVTNTYSTPSSSTENVPTGASTLVITVIAAGGGGSAGSGSGHPGGPGALSVKGTTTKIVLVSSDWGKPLLYTVGAGGTGAPSGVLGNGSAGGDSLVSGSLNAGSIVITAHGGGGGTTSATGSSGTATGGDTNTTGGGSTAGAGGVVGVGGSNGNDGQISFAYT